MADRIVYLVEQMPEDTTGHRLEFVDDVALGELLAGGWETSTTIPNRTVTVAGKSVPATMMILKQAADNRGVAMRERSEDRGPIPGGSNTMVLHDDYGGARHVTVGQAFVETLQGIGRGITNLGEHPGHLGAPKNHNMPGLTIISGELIHKAYDLGQTAGIMGRLVTDNPFPEGSGPSQRWLMGFNSRTQVGDQEITSEARLEAERLGQVTAQQLGKDDVASCPYVGQLKDAWLKGFVAGGGTIEG